MSKRNIGKNKFYDRIAACLLAFACEIAFNQSYGGFASLLPKTMLIDHYCRKYGFQQFGRQLAVDYEESLTLIRKQAHLIEEEVVQRKIEGAKVQNYLKFSA